MDVKSCAVCGQVKPVTAYTKRSGSSGRRGTCRACTRRRLRMAARAAAAGGGTGEAEQFSPVSIIEAADQPLSTASKPKRKRKRRRRRGGSPAGAKQLAALSPAAAPAEERKPVRPPNKIIVPFKGRFTYDTAVLNDKGTGMIRLRGRRETGKRWSTEIPTEMAVRMVNEGAAGIIHPGLIHKLYTKSDFRLLILQRDGYKCRYCGRYGDTIDHVQPKSKGGLSSPGNCVCACGDCNLKKADSLDFVYYDEF